MSEESIPAERFEVSGPAIYQFAVITAIAAGIIAIIGLSLMLTQPVGSNAFWTGTAESLFGFSALIIAGVDYHLTYREHQTRMLHLCESIEEYKELLTTDQGLHYAFRVSGFIANHDKINQDLGAHLATQTGKDTSRFNLYCVDGKPIPNDQQRALYGDQARYANQSIVSDLVALLTSRYACQNVSGVYQRPVEPQQGEYNTRYNLLSGGDIMEVEQLMCIRDMTDVFAEPLKYLVGKVRVDFRTGDAIFTWSSPQDERPKF